MNCYLRLLNMDIQMGDACATHGTVSKGVQNFNPKNLGKGSTTLEQMGYVKDRMSGLLTDL